MRQGDTGWVPVSRLVGEEAEADERAGQVEQPLEQVRPPLVANTEAAKTEQPGLRALDHPAVPAEPFARLDPAAGDVRGDAPGAQCPAAGGEVVRLVAVQLGRPEPRSTRSSARPNDRRDRIDQRHQLGRVVGVGGREPDAKWDAAAVDD